MITVVAPAGYGKSTLLAQWAASRIPRVSWITIDEHDNDPAVLLAYLTAALDRIDPESRVMDGQTAGIAQELEDRIARVDRELEMAELMEQQARDAELLRLWRERVGLLDALVDVHVTRASNVGL